MNERPITTLLFDFDGTLLDTNELITQTFLTVLGERFPGKYDRESVLPFNGPTLKQTFDAIDPEMSDELLAAYYKVNQTLHDELAVEFEGVSETLNKLKAHGFKMAIVSSKRRDSLDKSMKLISAREVFDVIIGADDVTNPKPDPEPILLALEQLGASKDESLMIGDNYHDIVGGQNAGVRTAGVAWSAKGEQYLATFNPDYMLQHISDLLEITGVGVK
ncbi:pyrophosphatase PpaX [Chungangia koreensis]|uniref:Pyrophosphatase PpaX n=1 Tax=Chungangia koreensis TaxID=752657 RepID=A0ABV8X876_9LACT